MTETTIISDDAGAPVVYTVRVHYVAGDQVPFWAEVDEHPSLTVFGRDLGELFGNIAEGVGHLERGGIPPLTEKWHDMV